ncbi:Cytochrome P450 [Halovenus aranensis]|uniref:Cytochrome P450 n=1 Tax=Halovenus aranensis TaxID=890420 RepID=A0A1G8VVT0_9EURY|nr:cytochrome P450 [Halovenus aranensis]SDJ69350.1 Cytochrome P450 [Halovenus aranensis]
MNERPPAAHGRHPVIGHTVSLLRGPLDAIQRWGRTDEDLVRLQIAGQTMVLVTAPDPAKQVLATDSESYQKAELVRDRLGTLQGNSLVLLEGQQWRDRRQTLQPAFRPAEVSATGAVATDHAREMVATWGPGASIRVVDETRTFVLGVLAEALFGLELRNEQTPIHEAATDILARLDLRSPSTYLPEWVPTPTNRRFQRAVSTLHDRLDVVVDDGGSDDSLLGRMRAAGLSSSEMRDELIALLFAGYDSTATALSCTLGLLGTHPQIQADLRRDLAVSLDGTPTAEDVHSLDVLDAVVEESLRLYPPQYLLFREPTADTTLAGYQVSAGTPVVVAPWVLHRDPTFWEAPSAFRPERWLDGGPDCPEYAYLPYGGGPRYCLGANMADQLLRLAVAVVCQHGRFRASEPVSVTAGPTLAVDETLRLRLTD